MSNLYSVGQMNQLGDSLEAEGFTADDVTKLKQYANLADSMWMATKSFYICPSAKRTESG